MVTTSLNGGVGPDSMDVAEDVVLQPDGRIVAAGAAMTESSSSFALSRYQTDGALDVSFGGDGTLTTDFGSGTGDGTSGQARALVVQPDGRIVAAGSESHSGSTEFALARYQPDGALDPSFDDDGKLTTNISDTWPHADTAEALALQSDGRIIAAGRSGDNVDGSEQFALARYTPDGSLDANFGADGKVTTDFDHLRSAEPASKMSSSRRIPTSLPPDMREQDSMATTLRSRATRAMDSRTRPRPRSRTCPRTSREQRQAPTEPWSRSTSRQLRMPSTDRSR